jgi:hypothetical protein
LLLAKRADIVGGFAFGCEDGGDEHVLACQGLAESRLSSSLETSSGWFVIAFIDLGSR